MAEDLTDQWQRLSLVAEEVQGIQIGDEVVAETEIRGQHCLVGRIPMERG